MAGQNTVKLYVCKMIVAIFMDQTTHLLGQIFQVGEDLEEDPKGTVEVMVVVGGGVVILITGLITITHPQITTLIILTT